MFEWVCYVVTSACLAGQECHSCPRVVHFFLPPPGGIVKGVAEMFDAAVGLDFAKCYINMGCNYRGCVFGVRDDYS